MTMEVANSLRSLIRDTNMRWTSRTERGFLAVFLGGVWLDRAPADCRLPVCVYRITTERFERNAKGVDHIMRVVFQMYGSADSTEVLVEAQSRLKDLLDGTTLSPEGYDRAICVLRQSGTPALEDDAWMIEDEYEIRGTKTN